MENLTYTQINVTNKTTYLEFRAAWKIAYFDKIKQIRQAKLDLKQAHRENKHGMEIVRVMNRRSELVNDLHKMLADKVFEAHRAQQRYLKEKEDAHA